MSSVLVIPATARATVTVEQGTAGVLQVEQDDVGVLVVPVAKAVVEVAVTKATVVVVNETLQGAGGAGLPAGGTTGQIPKKQSNANFDIVWADEAGGGGPHSHVIADTTGLQAALDGKSATGHSHSGLAPAGGTAGHVLKKIDGSDYNYSWQADVTGGGGWSGTVELDFGASGQTDVAFDVTGQAAILAGSLPRAWVLAKATVDHSIDEHRVEEIDVMAGNVVAGTGFTIYGKTRNAPLYGKFNVAWAW